MPVELVKAERSMALTDWGGAAERGLQARKEREGIIRSVLKEGADFGVIPGTPKPTLLKPGAEKIADCLNLYPDYEPLKVHEDWDKPLFFYQYRCVLKHRGTDATIATGIGSCNSMESRYRWRKTERACPKCQKASIIKGKAEYGGGFVCFKKKGGCGAKFKDDDAAITGQPDGKVPNDDVYTLVNTIDKMAQKRALVAASLNLGFSEQFTQDMEDIGPGAHEEEYPTAEEQPPIDEPGAHDGPEPPQAAKPSMLRSITEPQRRRLFAISKELQKRLDIGDAALDGVVKAILKQHGFISSKDITADQYDAICQEVKGYGEPPDA